MQNKGKNWTIYSEIYKLMQNGEERQQDSKNMKHERLITGLKYKNTKQEASHNTYTSEKISIL